MVKAQKTKTKKVGGTTKVSAITKPKRSDNPMDWLYDNPLGSYPDFTFGVLKQSYQGFRNRASEFAIRKLMPGSREEVDASTFDPASVTAYRDGVVLPPDALDCLDTSQKALLALDLAALPTHPALLIYVSLSFPDATRLHHAWEESRAFCFEMLGKKRGLLTLLIQHRPGEVGSDNPVHSHLLVCPRRIDGTGFRGFAEELLEDEGQRVLHEEWSAFRKRWSGNG